MLAQFFRKIFAGSGKYLNKKFSDNQAVVLKGQSTFEQ